MSELGIKLKTILDAHGLDDTVAALGEACIAAGDDRIALGATEEGESFKEIGKTFLELED